MKMIVRTQIILMAGLLALPFTAQLARAQACSPGLSASDLLYGDRLRATPPDSDFTGIPNVKFSKRNSDSASQLPTIST